MATDTEPYLSRPVVRNSVQYEAQSSIQYLRMSFAKFRGRKQVYFMKNEVERRKIQTYVAILKHFAISRSIPHFFAIIRSNTWESHRLSRTFEYRVPINTWDVVGVLSYSEVLTYCMMKLSSEHTAFAVRLRREGQSITINF